MLILIAPAKRMRNEVDFFQAEGKPLYIEKSKEVLNYLQHLNVKQLQLLLKCNEKIALSTYLNYQQFSFSKKGVPALFAYDGIQYQYMVAHVMEENQLNYLQRHLRILSAFYGVLKPFDEVLPYRIELNDYLAGGLDLIGFWKDLWIKACDDDVILDLASKQYSRQIYRYHQHQKIVRCRFKEEDDGRLVEKGVIVKMARGRMVRYLAQNQIQVVEGIKGFSDLGFCYQESLSSEYEFVFIRKKNCIK